MACNCGSHASNWLCSLQSMVANTLTGLEEGGVLPYAFNTVELLYLTNVNARPFAGDPGQKIETKIKIVPTPIVETNIEIYNSEEGVKATMAAQSLSEQDWLKYETSWRQTQRRQPQDTIKSN